MRSRGVGSWSSLRTPLRALHDIPSAPHAALTAILLEARRLGFVGPGPVEPHIDRALDMTRVVEDPPSSALDLGSGGGLPGLPLALAWPTSRWFLLDGSTSRSRFLTEAVGSLDLGDRVTVVEERAEVAGRGPLRASVDLVVARSFGGPGVTAECAAPFLLEGGRLVVAEPPGGRPSRWDAGALLQLGMELGPARVSPTACQVIYQVGLCPARFPRRTGIPAKRPLF